MIELSDMDILMGNSIGESLDHSIENGAQENGFVDPRVLSQVHDHAPSDDVSEKPAFSESSGSTSQTATRKPWKPTGCCYDDRMKLHANADFSASPAHPEDPRRIEAIMTELKNAGLIFNGTDSELEEVLKHSPTSFMYRISAREATFEEICTAHTAKHFHWVEGLSQMSSAELRELSAQLDSGRKSLYVGNLSYEAALISAGGAIETCKNVVAGNVKNALAIIRPPGHHAEEKEAMGFCIFNNVPIAAKVCQIDYPETCRKILILDWDVHHGNGIQNIFYNDPNVLYISLHVYQNGNFYPGAPDDPSLADGGLSSCGSGAGEGRNINIGWDEQGVGDGEYMAAFQRIVMPIAQEFDPDLVIVSAGFDAASGDELGQCFVTPACYSHMTHMLMSLAGGKVAVCLEGGYDLKAISRSALAVAKTLMGEPPERMVLPPVSRDAALVLAKVKQIQAPYWECMRSGQVQTNQYDATAVRLNEVIRTYQRRTLSEKHKMVSLYVQRNQLFRTFEGQILATQSLHAARRILLIIHDPPELLAIPDPIDNKVAAHNAWIADGVMPYIDWAISHGFGVIDVNVPMFVAPLEDVDKTYLEKYTENEITTRTKDIMCYLWDNYLENYDTQEITLMGVGESYQGVKQLLTNRDCKDKITSVLNFVTGSLRPVRSETDSELSSWYRTHSRVYVSSDHACWNDPDSQRKIKKNRFGKLFCSDQIGLNRMMARHMNDATDWILEEAGIEKDDVAM